MQIHELNDFIGALGSNSFLPVDNGTDTGKLSFTDLFAADTVTTLWEGNLHTIGDTVQLSDSLSNYDFFDIYYYGNGTTIYHNRFVSGKNITSISLPVTLNISSDPETPGFGGTSVKMENCKLTVSGTDLTLAKDVEWKWDGTLSNAPTCTTIPTSSAFYVTILRVDGISTPANSKGVIEVKTAHLYTADWLPNHEQTITVEGVTATNNVIVTYAPYCIADAADWGVICTAQGQDSLTFMWENMAPIDSLTVYVMIVG